MTKRKEQPPILLPAEILASQDWARRLATRHGLIDQEGNWQTALAAKAGIGRTTIVRLMFGDYGLTALSILRIGAAFELSQTEVDVWLAQAGHWSYVRPIARLLASDGLAKRYAIGVYEPGDMMPQQARNKYPLRTADAVRRYYLTARS